MNCPYCGAPVPVSPATCPACGSPLGLSSALEFVEDGETKKKPIAARSEWPSAGDPAVTFEERGGTRVFTLPLTVRERGGRQYTSMNAIGDIVFDNGSRKRVYEKLRIQ